MKKIETYEREEYKREGWMLDEMLGSVSGEIVSRGDLAVGKD